MQKFKEQKRREWQEERNREKELEKWHERHMTDYSDIMSGRSGFLILNQNDADKSSNQPMKKTFDRRNRRKRRKVSFDIVISLFSHSLL